MAQLESSEVQSDNVRKVMLSSIVEEHTMMSKLNETFKNFDMERSETVTTEISTSFKDLHIKMEKNHSEEIKKIQKNLETKVKECASSEASVKTLEETIRTNTTEIADLKETIKTHEKSIQSMTRTIEELKKSKNDLDNEVKKMKEDKKQIEVSRKEALTKQIQAQRECDYLREENIRLEESYYYEKEEMVKTFDSVKTMQRSYEKANEDKFIKKIDTIETAYKDKLEKMKQEEKRSFDFKTRELNREIKTMERERSSFTEQINDQESEFQQLKKAYEKLEEEIYKYQQLLNTKIDLRTYSTVNKELIEQKNVLHIHEQKQTTSKRSSQIDISTASVKTSHKDPEKPPESDLKPTPLSINVDPTGNCLTIHNSSKNEIDISGWKIESTLPGGDKAPFRIPDGTKISLEKDLKILSKSASDKKAPGDIIATCQTWGTGKGHIKVKETNGKESIHPIN